MSGRFTIDYEEEVIWVSESSLRAYYRLIGMDEDLIDAEIEKRKAKAAEKETSDD